MSRSVRLRIGFYTVAISDVFATLPNFLEKLAAEWYEYNGYFCRTNIRFGKTGHGGHLGEIDVIAYHPKTQEFIHIECSTDAWTLQRKREVFRTKFGRAQKYYDEKFPFEKKVIRKIAITGFSRPRDPGKLDFGLGIEVHLVPDFIVEIASGLSQLDPWKVGINEASYPLLRAMQWGTFYLVREERRKSRHE